MTRLRADRTRVSVEPGWYPDPFDPSQDRWWNGQAWTENTQAGPQSPDPYATARQQESPADGDYIATLTDDGADLPDYGVLASVEEGAIHDSHDAPFEVGEENTPRTRRRLGKILGFGGLVVALLALSGVAAAYFLFGGRGPQPEDVLPADTAFMVRVDLDPSLDQKAKVGRLISSLPEDALPKGSQDPKAALLDVIFPGDSAAQSDALAWLGPRIGIGALANGSEVAPVLVASVSDEQALDAFMSKHAAEFFYTVHDGYAVIANAESVVAQVTQSEEHLSTNSSFAQNLEALQVSPLALAYADLPAISQAAGSLAEQAAGVLPIEVDTDATGTTMLGIAAEADSLRIVAVTNGVLTQDAPSVDLSVSGDGLSSLPASTLGAVSVANLSGILNDLIEDFGGTESDEVASIDSALNEIGVSLQQVIAALGTQTTLVFLPQEGDSAASVFPVLAVQGPEGNAEDIQRTLQTVLDGVSPGLGGGEEGLEFVESNGTVYVYPKDFAQTLSTLLEDPSLLGQDGEFTTLFPSGANGFISAYVSNGAIAEAVEQGGDERLSIIQGVGLTVTVDPSSPGNSRTEITLLIG